MDAREYYQSLAGAAGVKLTDLLCTMRDWDLDVAVEEPIHFIGVKHDEVDMIVRGDSYNLAMALAECERKSGWRTARNDGDGELNYLLDADGIRMNITYSRFGEKFGWNEIRGKNKDHLELVHTPWRNKYPTYGLEQESKPYVMPPRVNDHSMADSRKSDDGSGLHRLIELDPKNKNKAAAAIGMEKPLSKDISKYGFFATVRKYLLN